MNRVNLAFNFNLSNISYLEKCTWSVLSGENVLPVLYHNETEVQGKNYWLSKEMAPGSFILDLGCETLVSLVQLVNTHNAELRDRSTKEFKVLVSKNKNEGWSEVIHKTLEDSRQQNDPLPMLKFPFAAKKAKYIKFEILTFYGKGGGLQYFHVKGKQKWIAIRSSYLCSSFLQMSDVQNPRR